MNQFSAQQDPTEEAKKQEDDQLALVLALLEDSEAHQDALRAADELLDELVTMGEASPAVVHATQMISQHSDPVVVRRKVEDMLNFAKTLHEQHTTQQHAVQKQTAADQHRAMFYGAAPVAVVYEPIKAIAETIIVEDIQKEVIAAAPVAITVEEAVPVKEIAQEVIMTAVAETPVVLVPEEVTVPQPVANAQPVITVPPVIEEVMAPVQAMNIAPVVELAPVVQELVIFKQDEEEIVTRHDVVDVVIEQPVLIVTEQPIVVQDTVEHEVVVPVVVVENVVDLLTVVQEEVPVSVPVMVFPSVQQWEANEVMVDVVTAPQVIMPVVVAEEEFVTTSITLVDNDFTPMMDVDFSIVETNLIAQAEQAPMQIIITPKKMPAEKILKIVPDVIADITTPLIPMAVMRPPVVKEEIKVVETPVRDFATSGKVLTHPQPAMFVEVVEEEMVTEQTAVPTTVNPFADTGFDYVSQYLAQYPQYAEDYGQPRREAKLQSDYALHSFKMAG